MSVATFIEKFVGLQQQKAKATSTDYKEFVAGIAMGQEPDAAEVERLLRQASKSVDDLRRDVELCQHRMALRALVNSMPNLEAQQKELRQQVAKADDELANAEQRHSEVTNPLYARLETIERALSDAEDAKRELYHTCNDPDLLRQRDELNAEIQKSHEQLRTLTDRANCMAEKAKSERERAKRELSGGDQEARLAVADHYQTDAESSQWEVKKLTKAQKALEKRREQLEEQMRQA